MSSMQDDVKIAAPWEALRRWMAQSGRTMRTPYKGDKGFTVTPYGILGATVAFYGISDADRKGGLYPDSIVRGVVTKAIQSVAMDLDALGITYVRDSVDGFPLLIVEPGFTAKLRWPIPEYPDPHDQPSEIKVQLVAGSFMGDAKLRQLETRIAKLESHLHAVQDIARDAVPVCSDWNAKYNAKHSQHPGQRIAERLVEWLHWTDQDGVE